MKNAIHIYKLYSDKGKYQFVRLIWFACHQFQVFHYIYISNKVFRKWQKLRSRLNNRDPYCMIQFLSRFKSCYPSTFFTKTFTAESCLSVKSIDPI